MVTLEFALLLMNSKIRAYGRAHRSSARRNYNNESACAVNPVESLGNHLHKQSPALKIISFSDQGRILNTKGSFHELCVAQIT